MMGYAVVFSIPVGLGIIEPADERPFSLGMLCRFVTIPLGILAAGIAIGIEPPLLLRNVAPIAVVSALAGAFVLVEILSCVARKPLAALGERIGIGAKATLGLLACLARIIPLLQNLRTFTERGKVVACAFAVSGSFALASNLAFVAGVEPQMMGRMLLAKAVAALTALGLALIVTRGEACRSAAHRSAAPVRPES